MKHTISVLVENKFGVLARVAGLFSARGYNISSLSVSETIDPEVSYMTIVVDAKDEGVLEQIIKQLNKLIDVITVTDFTKRAHIDRELFLLRLKCPPKDKAKISGVLKKYPAKLIQCKDGLAVVEAILEQNQVKDFMDAFEPFGIVELARTGRLAISAA